MMDALGLRVSVEDLFEDGQDAETLVRMSGGCVRDLIHLITLSYEMSEGDRLTTQGVGEAVQEMRAEYARQLSDADYERLAQIAARRSVPRDKQTLELLMYRRALEYYDRGGKVWLDVHPLIVEIDRFQDAYRRLNSIETG